MFPFSDNSPVTKYRPNSGALAAITGGIQGRYVRARQELAKALRDALGELVYEGPLGEDLLPDPLGSTHASIYETDRSTWPKMAAEKAVLDFQPIRVDDRYTVFILGAGASKDAGFPICTDFFSRDYLSQIGVRVEFLPTPSSSKGIEHVMMEAFESDSVQFDRLRHYYERILFKAESKFLNVTGEIPTRQWISESQHYFLLLGTLYEAISTSRRVVVISFNHDLCIEELLQMSGFNYGTLTTRMYGVGEYPGLPRFGDDFVLLKLHGSFNFAHCPQCGGIWCDSQWLWDKGDRWPCASCGAPGYNFYVPPTVTKNISALREAWEDARHVLRNAEDVFVIGYSMPEYDTHAAELIREISPDSTLAIVDPNAPEVAAKFGFVPESRRFCCRLGLKDFTTALMYDVWPFEPFGNL